MLKRHACHAAALLALCGPAALPTARSVGAAEKASPEKKAKASADGEEELLKPENEVKTPPLVVARPGEVQEKSLDGRYRFFLGTTHSHSGFSGDHAKTIATKFNKGQADYSRDQPEALFKKAKENHYDFYFVTDHSSPEQNDFYKNGMTDEHWAVTEKQAEAATTPTFLALRGYEFSRNTDPDQGGFGHLNVLNAPDWTSAYAPGHTFAWVYDHIAGESNQGVVGQFNHPAMPNSGKAAKNFANYAGRTKARNDAVCLAEIWNSGDKMNYVPVVKKMWALGWKVAPTCGTDVHGVFGIENKRLRTGVLAESLTTSDVMAALKARRVYATLEPLMHLEFHLNDAQMGTALAKRPKGDLVAKVFVNDPGGAPLSRVEIIGANYDAHGGESKVLTTLQLADSKKVVEAPVPNGFDFYYAVVYRQDIPTARAFAAPVWMDND